MLIPADGAVMSCVTDIDAVDTHPLLPVTVTVYVPCAVIDAASLLPKLPLHA